MGKGTESTSPAKGKPTNPKDLLGLKKVSMSSIPSSALMGQAIVHMLGEKKYGHLNWREKGVRARVYMDAIQRHLHAWNEGEDVDSESGVSHLMHIVACCNILYDSMRNGGFVDDRALGEDNAWLEEYNKLVLDMLDRV